MRLGRRLWTRALAPLVATLSLVGCAPTLSDDRYGCPDGRCPDGFFCHADMICRRAVPTDAPMPLDASTSLDTPATDAQVAFLTPCTTEVECGSMRCFRGSAAWPRGFCTPECVSETACDGLPSDPFCDDVLRACIVYCGETMSACPSDLVCVGVFRVASDPTSTLGTCRPADAPIEPSSDVSCVDDLGCGVEELCAERRCARPCAAGELGCAPGERCVPSMAGEVCRPT